MLRGPESAGLRGQSLGVKRGRYLYSLLNWEKVKLTMSFPPAASSSGHGVSQVRILEWVAIRFSRMKPFLSQKPPVRMRRIYQLPSVPFILLCM